MTDRTKSANRVLASIPAKDYKRLQAHLEPVDLKFGAVLYEPGKAIKHVYFPVNSLISLLTTVDKRRSLEVGMVGNEGMAGMPFILGVGVSGVRAIVQGGGSALRMASAPFRVEFDRNAPLQEALFRYTYALMAQISQTAACNRFHDAEGAPVPLAVDDAGPRWIRRISPYSRISGAYARPAARRRHAGGQCTQATQADQLFPGQDTDPGRARTQEVVLLVLPDCENGI